MLRHIENSGMQKQEYILDATKTGDIFYRYWYKNSCPVSLLMFYHTESYHALRGSFIEPFVIHILKRSTPIKKEYLTKMPSQYKKEELLEFVFSSIANEIKVHYGYHGDTCSYSTVSRKDVLLVIDAVIDRSNAPLLGCLPWAIELMEELLK